MPENANVIGDLWTDESIALLTKLGWRQHGPKNFDIMCTNHKKQRRGQPHGVDSIFSYYDPYLKQKVGILVESKTRQWRSIDDGAFNDWVGQVISCLECADEADELKEFDFDSINTALILCWCHDGEYNHNNFLEYLQKIKIPNKHRELNVFIASNYEILRWCSLIGTVEELKNDEKTKLFKYFYPSVSNSAAPKKTDYLTIIHMFSKYVFAKREYVDNNGINNTVTKKQSIIFNFDDVSVKSLLMMYDAFRQYQFEEADEYVIYLYKTKAESRLYVEEFKKLKEIEFKEQEIESKLIIKYMDVLTGMPNIPYKTLGLSEED